MVYKAIAANLIETPLMLTRQQIEVVVFVKAKTTTPPLSPAIVGDTNSAVVL
jgi:hypothetical protein